ncbi:unnamed protein product, partial [Porites lobata]
YTDLDEYSDKSNDAVPDITQRIAALESIYSRRLSSSSTPKERLGCQTGVSQTLKKHSLKTLTNASSFKKEKSSFLSDYQPRSCNTMFVQTDGVLYLPHAHSPISRPAVWTSLLVALVYSCTLPLFQQLMGRAWSLRIHGHFDAKSLQAELVKQKTNIVGKKFFYRLCKSYVDFTSEHVPILMPGFHMIAQSLKKKKISDRRNYSDHMETTPQRSQRQRSLKSNFFYLSDRWKVVFI